MDTNPNNHLSAQATFYIKAVAEIFYAVLQKSSPLDNELKHFFRKHAQCGGRDRYQISESCFALFRWYGWLRATLPGGLPARPDESKKFCQALAAALWLQEHNDFPMFDYLLERSDLESSYITATPPEFKGKIKGLGNFFKIRKLDLRQLIPDWLSAMIPDNIQVETLIETLQTRPPVWIRTQARMQADVQKQLNDHSIDYAVHPICANAMKILSPTFKATQLEGYSSGQFEIQDLASQCIGLACQVQPGDTWWDVCAGSGGKTLLMADALQGQGRVVATDIRDHVLVQLNKRAKRTGYRNIVVDDLADVCASKDVFDGVLIDAPCSCTGVWRRSPDIKWTTTVNDIANYIQTQLEIFQMAAPKVKAGGFLVYATCSLTVQENEAMIDQFLKLYSDFRLVDFDDPLTGQPMPGMQRIPFQPFDNDAMFVARLQRV